MDLNPKSIRVAIEYGMPEDSIVAQLGCTHEDLRRCCIHNNIPLNFNFISASMILEIQHRDWNARKLVARYRLTLPIVRQIVSYNYEPHIPKPVFSVAELIALAESGNSYANIAEQLGTSIYHIKKAFKKYNLKIKTNNISDEQYDLIVEDLIAKKLSNSEIAKKNNLHPSMISHIKKEVMVIPKRKNLVRVDPKLIVKLVDAGFTQAEVAKQLDITQPTVSRLYKVHKE